MVTRSQKIRLGIFLITAVIVFMGSGIFLAGRTILQRKDIYYVAYRNVSVSGIDVGTQVRYHGVRVGSVTDVRIDPEDVTRVILEISMNAGTPIKNDVKAVISSVGITGIKRIELVGGSNESGYLEPGSYIVPGESALYAITGKAEVIAEKAELLLTNMGDLTSETNRRNIEEIIANVAYISGNLRSLVENNSAKVDSIINETGKIATNVNGLVSDARTTLAQLNDVRIGLEHVVAVMDTLGGEISDADIGGAVERLKDAADQATKTLTHLDLTILKGRTDLLVSLESLRESMDYFNEFTRIISENPSIVFRGYKSINEGRPGE